MIIPGQLLPVHVRDSSDLPLQVDPPNIGKGLSHGLVLFLVPDPQVELHDVQEDHDPQCPSTGKLFNHTNLV